jgi:ATP/maltotriose-dependent transcriptional regulator MalT
VEIWEEALEHTADARGRAVLRRCMGRALWQAGNEDAALAHLEAGVSELGAAALSSDGALLRQELAMERLRLGDVAYAVREAEEVLAAIDPAEAPEAVARLQIVLCTAHGYRGRSSGAQQAGESAIRLSEQHDLPGAAFLAHYTVASLARYDGDANAFFTNANAAQQVASRMHSTALESWPLSIKTERLTFDGHLEEAIASGEAALAIDRAIGQGMVLPRSAAFLAVAQRLSGDVNGARRHLEEAVAFVEGRAKSELRTVVVVESTRAYFDFLDEDFAAAGARLDALLTRLEAGETLVFHLLHPHVLPLAAMVAFRQGNRTAARERLDAIDGLAPRTGSSARAYALHVGGLIAAGEGHGPRALLELQRSVTAWEQLSRPHYRAQTLLELADLRERFGDRSGAVETMLAAARAFEDMGATPDAARAVQRLRHWGVRAGVDVKRRASGAAISRREREIVKHIARGSQNREIASDLGISELTVETHVRNILRKLGLRSRTQVAAQVESLIGEEREAYALVP